MKTLVIVLGILIALVGLSLLVYPEFFLGWIEQSASSPSLYGAAVGLRLLFGLILVKVASQSRYPMVFRVLGSSAILAAIIFLCIGQETFSNFISEVITRFGNLSMIGGVLSICVGAFLVYACFGKRET